MSFANKYNKGSAFSVDTTGFVYRNLSELQPGEIVKLCGLFVNAKRTRRKKWDSPVAIGEDCFWNLPTYMTDQVRDILADAEAVADIQSGKVGFIRRDYTYKDADTGEDVNGIGIEWVDL